MTMEHSCHHMEILSHLDRGPERFLEQDRLLEFILANGSIHRGSQVTSHVGSNSRKVRKTKTLVTQLLKLYPGLLEDLSPGLMQTILDKSHHWEFNAFHLERFTGGHSLSTLCLHIFYCTGLISSFGLDPADLLAFFRVVERGYHVSNPYHTLIHAADVTQAIYVFCQQPCVRAHLTKLELFATLVAAMCHDLDHPGVNEKFLVSTGSHLAVLYDNVSVLENHHWRSAISCFIESGLAQYLTDSQFAEFTDLVRSLVLATDISRQQEFLTQFRFFLDTSDRDLSVANNRHFLLQIAIKCADISNPCRSWPVSRVWSLRACEEFFRQGDRERELGLGVTPICDRFNVTVAKVQVGFYSFVAEPLFKEWDRFLNSPLSSKMMINLYANQAIWEQDVEREELSSTVEMKTAEAQPSKERPSEQPAPVFINKVINAKNVSRRRLSLPATDPLHRVFDQMIHPDCDLPRSQAQLRRNFSLTDRRRSSLLRGLYNRTSLKPARGRVSMSRPSSVCLDNNRTLQSKENRVPEQMDPMKTDLGCDTTQLNKTELEKENAFLHLALKSCLNKRRGSAPSNLILGDSNIMHGPGHVLLQQQSHLAVSAARRGSLPSDLLKNSLPKQFSRNKVLSSSSNNNSGGKRPSLLRRRSMGTELLSLGSNQSIKERQCVQKYLNRPF